MRNYFIAFIAVLSLFSACKKNDPQPPPPADLKEGVFIVNQGTYTASNASLSYLEFSANTLTNNLFSSVNGSTLGDVAQSITIQNDVAYIVVNNSGLIYAIDTKDASLKGKIQDLVSPRYMLVINNDKAYVSDLYSQAIAVVNPTTFEVTGSIPLGYTSEEMSLIGNEVFVANWSAYTQEPLLNNNVIVLNSESDQVVDTIKVGIEPNSMVVDKNDNLWVLCSGGYTHAENASLWQIDAVSHTVVDSLIFEDILSYPSNLEINGTGDTLFYIDNGIFKMSLDANKLPEESFIRENETRNFVFLGVDPVTSEVFVSDPLDNLSEGNVFHFNEKGGYITTYKTGIVPAAFGFNY